MKETKPICPSCDSRKVDTYEVRDHFQYGLDGPDAIWLSAVIPFRICEDCDFEYADYGAEERYGTAVTQFLRAFEEDKGVRPFLIKAGIRDSRYVESVPPGKPQNLILCERPENALKFPTLAEAQHYYLNTIGSVLKPVFVCAERKLTRYWGNG